MGKMEGIEKIDTESEKMVKIGKTTWKIVWIEEIEWNISKISGKNLLIQENGEKLW